MIDDPSKPVKPYGGYVLRRLIEETGITEDQGRELIGFLGLDWSSLLREARILTKKP